MMSEPLTKRLIGKDRGVDMYEYVFAGAFDPEETIRVIGPDPLPGIDPAAPIGPWINIVSMYGRA
jgi:hypothetical protein